MLTLNKFDMKTKTFLIELMLFALTDPQLFAQNEDEIVPVCTGSLSKNTNNKIGFS